MQEIFLSASGVNKSYEGVIAIQDITFDVKKSEIFGFIGPDGAGKTTLFRILTTLLLPDTGKVQMNNFDVIKDYKKVRQIIGYMPGKFSLYQDLSVEENLSFFATVFGTTIDENYDLIKDIYVQIEPFKKRRAGKLSGGMKQKLALSCALIHKPEILVLDEPTTGVDAVSRQEFWEMLKKLQKQGITVIVSTPYMDEATLCDRIALMQSGKIMMIDTPGKITDNFNKRIYNVSAGDTYKLLKDLRHVNGAESAFPFGQSIHLILNEEVTNIREIEDTLKRKNHDDLQINVIKPTIEDCFMNLMQNK